MRAIAGNIRDVIKADLVGVSLPDAASGRSRLFALDFPHGKGLIKEELVVTLSPAHRKAMDTLKPVVIDTRERDYRCDSISSNYSSPDELTFTSEA